MAGRTKKTVEENQEVVSETVKKVVEQKVVDNKLAQENEELKNQLNEQTSQIAQLSQMLAQLQSQMMTQNSVQNQKTDNDDEVILLGSAMYGRESLCDSFGHEVVVFNGFGSVKPVQKELFTSIYTPKNEKFFRSGLVYFVGESEKYYDIKKIRKPLIILTEEQLIDVLNMDNVEMTKELNKATSNKTNKVAMSNLPNIIALMIINNKVNANPMVIQTLSSYFGLDLNKTISMVMWATQTGICSNNNEDF